ncbi:MAG: response regulator [Bacteroidetes bacterium]|nr:MAG: response regulator [Bacteroidota bacterium]
MDIIIADDSARIRTGLKRLLATLPFVRVVDEAEDGRRAESTIVRLQPHLAILDIRMPGQSGIDVIRAVRERSPSTVFVILTNYFDDQSVTEAMHSGASYVFDKSADLDPLLDHVRRLATESSSPSPKVRS